MRAGLLRSFTSNRIEAVHMIWMRVHAPCANMDHNSIFFTKFLNRLPPSRFWHLVLPAISQSIFTKQLSLISVPSLVWDTT
jgi:hypothetical protein